MLKFLKMVGVDNFVLNNQRLPCVLSHPGTTCTANAAQLYKSFWCKIVPPVVLSRVIWAAITRTKLSPLSTLRWMVFIFLSTGLPGYVFCLLKKILSREGAGTNANVLMTSFVGSLALGVLPRQQWAAVVTRSYVTSIVMKAVLVFQKTCTK